MSTPNGECSSPARALQQEDHDLAITGQASTDDANTAKQQFDPALAQQSEAAHETAPPESENSDPVYFSSEDLPSLILLGLAGTLAEPDGNKPNNTAQEMPSHPDGDNLKL